MYSHLPFPTTKGEVKWEMSPPSPLMWNGWRRHTSPFSVEKEVDVCGGYPPFTSPKSEGKEDGRISTISH
jgi:hypothetical protein